MAPNHIHGLPAVYPILDLDACIAAGVRPQDLLQSWSAIGLDLFQFRAKALTENEYLAWARALVGTSLQSPPMRLLANDHIRLSLGHPEIFSGVHIGQEDWTAASRDPVLMRQVLEPPAGFVLGFSTHNLKQLRTAREILPSCTYVALGPVFSSASKPGSTDEVLNAAELQACFAWWGGHRAACELVLIGGVDRMNFSQLIREDFRHRFGFLPIPAVIQSALDPAKLEQLFQYRQSLTA